MTPSSFGITTAMFISSVEPSNLLFKKGFLTCPEAEPTAEVLISAAIVALEVVYCWVLSGCAGMICCYALVRCLLCRNLLNDNKGEVTRRKPFWTNHVRKQSHFRQADSRLAVVSNTYFLRARRLTSLIVVSLFINLQQMSPEFLGDPPLFWTNAQDETKTLFAEILPSRWVDIWKHKNLRCTLVRSCTLEVQDSLRMRSEAALVGVWPSVTIQTYSSKFRSSWVKTRPNTECWVWPKQAEDGFPTPLRLNTVLLRAHYFLSQLQKVCAVLCFQTTESPDRTIGSRCPRLYNRSRSRRLCPDCRLRHTNQVYKQMYWTTVIKTAQMWTILVLLVFRDYFGVWTRRLAENKKCGPPGSQTRVSISSSNSFKKTCESSGRMERCLSTHATRAHTM